MKTAFLLVVIAGGAIGFMIPTRDSYPRQAESAQAPGPARETLLERKPSGHFYVNGEVNGQLVHFVVDTGASGVALTTRDARRLGLHFSPGEFSVVGSGASGPVRGKVVTFDSVSVDGKEVTRVEGAILEGLDKSLLGQTYLSRISAVQMNGDYMILR